VGGAAVKYIEVDEFIRKHGASQLNGFDLLKKLKEATCADVIPIWFIRKWHKKHYHSDVCTIVDDWRSYAESGNPS
jgi:hypothetical protein